MPRVQDAIPSLACRARKGCSNPLLLTSLRFAPESRPSPASRQSLARRHQGSSHDRPKTIESRGEAGHWEGDASRCAQGCDPGIRAAAFWNLAHPSLRDPVRRTMIPGSTASLTITRQINHPDGHRSVIEPEYRREAPFAARTNLAQIRAHGIFEVGESLALFSVIDF
jgi:hypothetical protein